MDTMSVVVRHACWSRDTGGLGWRHFIIRDRGGAWWNRFPWAQLNHNKRISVLTKFYIEIVLIQEAIMKLC